MKTVLAIRHLSFEDLGTLQPWFVTHGYDITYVDATTDNLQAIDVLSPDVVVVLGGPIGAYDEELYPFLREEMALIGKRLDSARPLMGICLGAQLIARLLGARVAPMGVKEIGYAPLALTPAGQDSVLRPLAGLPVLHWHGDRFGIPEGATHLASSAVCDHQAYMLGSTVLGLQFHLEADAATLERWLVGHACELGQAGIDVRALRAMAGSVQEVLPAAAHAVMSAWLQPSPTA